MTARLRVRVDDPVTSFSERTSSHKAAWARLEAAELRRLTYKIQVCRPDGSSGEELDLTGAEVQVWGKEPWTTGELRPEIWAVSYPMEFDGAVVNLFGGFNEKVRERLHRLVDWDQGLVSIGRALPDYGTNLVLKRAPDDVWLAKQLTELAWTAPYVGRGELNLNSRDCVLGDSHAVAHYGPTRLVLRNDGMTMHHLITAGAATVLSESLADIGFTYHHSRDRQFDYIILVFGNIDIRHHLLRQPDPAAAVDQLMRELWRQCHVLVNLGRAKMGVKLVPPLPVEHEGRKLPKTGWYKGTPYHGSRDQRLELVRRMWGRMNELAEASPWIEVDPWPTEWYRVDGEFYADNYMERPGSVHLAPRWYRWDLWKDDVNRELDREYHL